MRKIDERTYVSGQVDPADLPAIKAAGVAMIVNNRPDGEEPGQPAAAAIETAARAAGPKDSPPYSSARNASRASRARATGFTSAMSSSVAMPNTDSR